MRVMSGPSSTTDVEIATRLHSVAIHLLRRLAREDHALGLSAARLSALSVLVFGGPRTLGQLAAAEGVRPPTITRLVAAMEAEGLVERAGDPADGRVVRLAATEKGRAILVQGRDRRVTVLADALAGLGDDDRAAVSEATVILERVVSGL
jgi:DNA-binding MarR family transcriptional regulator